MATVCSLGSIWRLSQETRSTEAGPHRCGSAPPREARRGGRLHSHLLDQGAPLEGYTKCLRNSSGRRLDRAAFWRLPSVLGGSGVGRGLDWRSMGSMMPTAQSLRVLLNKGMATPWAPLVLYLAFRVGALLANFDAMVLPVYEIHVVGKLAALASIDW